MQARVQQRLASELGLQVESLPDNAALLWENQVVSEIAAPMNGTLFCAAQVCRQMALAFVRVSVAHQ